jgi:ribosomal protein L16 Arg81 hydroxylase
VQTCGTKQWKLGRHFVSQQEEDRRLIAGLDVRVLEPLDESDEGGQQEYSVIVRPGDALYLPPRVSHEGAALVNDCATLSVGFRAPSASDLISRLAETMSTQTSGAALKRYVDPDEVLTKLANENSQTSGDGKDENKNDKTQPAVDNELTQNTKQKVKQLLLDAVDELIGDVQDQKWDEWLGTFLTESKRYRFDYPLQLRDGSVAAEHHVAAFLQGSGTLCQAEGIAFAYSKSNSQSNSIHRLFVNGVCWNVSPKVPVHVIANERRLTLSNILAAAGSGDDEEVSVSNDSNTIHEETRDLFEDLVAKGYLYYVHKKDERQ